MLNVDICLHEDKYDIEDGNEWMEMSPPILVQHGGPGKCRLTTSSFYPRSLLYEFP